MSMSCPPALRCLVFLWEQICANCIQVIQRNGINMENDQNIKDSTLIDDQNVSDFEVRKSDVKKGMFFHHHFHNLFHLYFKLTLFQSDDGSYCELCELFLPIPVTYHMRLIHPGCGKRAKGKGYNSVGTYCEGWAGNCGEGGKGASSWYLMCETCHEK